VLVLLIVKTHAGHVTCITSLSEYTNWTDRQTDRRQTSTLCLSLDATSVITTSYKLTITKK